MARPRFPLFSCLLLNLAAATSVFAQATQFEWKSVERPILAQAEPTTAPEQDPFKDFPQTDTFTLQPTSDEPAASSDSLTLPAGLVAPPTDEMVSVLAERVENESDETRKADAKKLLVQIREQLAALGSLQGKDEEFKKAISRIKQQVEKTASDIEEVKNTPDFVAPESTLPLRDLPLKELESLLKEREAQLTQAKEQLANHEQSAKTSKSAIDTTDEQLAAAEALEKALPGQIEQARDGMAGLPPAGPLLTDLQTALYKSQIALWSAQKSEVKTEIDYYKAVKEAQIYERDIELRKKLIEKAKQKVAALTPAVEQAREAVRTKQVKEAKQAIAAVPEPLRPAAEINRLLTEQSANIQRKRDDLKSDQERIEKQVARWTYEEELLETQAESREESKILGLQLRSLLAELPSIESIVQSRSSRLDELEDARLNAYLVKEELDELEELDDPTVSFLEAPGVPASPDAKLREAASDVAAKRIAALSALDKQYTEYQEVGRDVLLKEFELTQLLTRVRDTITGRMLWTRSHPSMVDFRSSPSKWVEGDRLNLLFNPQLYVRISKKLVEDINAQPLLYFLIAGFGIILIMARQWMRSRIQKVAAKAQSRANTSLRPLLRTLGLTIADAAVWPGLLAFLASRIVSVFGDEPDIAAAAAGLSRLAIALFLVELVHDGCLPRGAAELLGIPADVARYIRRKVFRFQILAFPIAAFVVALHSDNATLSMRASERIFFIAAVLLGVRLVNQMLRSKSPLINAIDESGRSPLFVRFQPAIWLTSILVLLSIAVMSLIGFHNTAIQLVLRLEATLWLGIGLLLLQLILAATVKLHRRALRFESIRRDVEASQVEAAASSPSTTDDVPSAADPTSVSAIAASIPLETEEDSESVVERLTGQSQRLISTLSGIAFLFGAYVIWNGVLPALTQFQVYPIGDVEPGSDVQIVTLENLLAGIASVILTVTAARNLPGLLDFSVLERLGLDRSVRYAITTILSYVVSLIGIIIAGHLFGFSWDSVQWLAAGLTVGLGFGLQEIFANFVSGLIIFFEQPIRVGDIVTIDDVTGVVSRIRIRATTITNWDRKEYIVPNKEFITGRLLNWTLSDTTNRLVLTVGVAYGSDTEKAKTVLVDILDKHSLILDDPAPLVTLEELGNSSVNFVIRCYLPTLDKRLTATHELYTEIHKRFAEEGLEIPFPQTDLHIRDLPAAAANIQGEVA